MNNQPTHLLTKMGILKTFNVSKKITEEEVNDMLVHELILFAWKVAGTDRAVAQLSFGMTPVVAEIIATLNSQQVRAITTRPTACVRLRWADDAGLWRDLLTAAIDDEASLSQLQLHAKLKHCSELFLRNDRYSRQ